MKQDENLDRLLDAVTSNDNFIAHKLLEENPNLDVNAHDGHIISIACSLLSSAPKREKNGYFDMVKLLHKYGADLTSNFNSPLMYACRDGNIELVDYLLDNGVDINAECGLEYAINNSQYGFDENFSIVRHLVNKGINKTIDSTIICDPFREDFEKMNPSENKIVGIFVYLDENGFDVVGELGLSSKYSSFDEFITDLKNYRIRETLKVM